MPRELIGTGTDDRYVSRDEEGQFSESMVTSVAATLKIRTGCNDQSKPGEGDRGDR